jgi:hypothetical protein
MGQKKNQLLLQQGKITQAEYQNRLKQAAADRSASQRPKNKKKSKKVVTYNPGDAAWMGGQMGRTIPSVARQVKERRSGKALYTGTGNSITSGNPLKAYLKTLVNPALNMARIPDAFDRPTACFRTISSFSPTISLDNVNQGRFSFALKPIFGSLANPTTYQSAVVNPTNITAGTWATADWTSPNNYASSLQMGRDPRIDLNAPFLTSTPPGFFGMTFNGGDLSSTTLVSGQPATQTPFADNRGVAAQIFSPGAPPPFNNAGGGVVKLPFGDWAVTISAKFQVSVVPAGAFEAINFQNVANPVTKINMSQPQTSAAATGATFEAVAYCQVTAQSNADNLSFCITNSQANLGNAVADPNVTVSSATITLVPANFAAGNTFNSGGVVMEVRPVAMAVLVTYMGTTLNNGGEISISYVPAELLANNYFQNNNTGVGQLQLYENLRNLDNSYDGPLKDGAYCIWAPYSGEDLDLYTVDGMNSHPYPGIICSGIFTPDATVGSLTTTVRVETYIVYEFVTKYTMFETIHQPGSQSTIDAALSALKGQPFGCKNKEHLAWIRNFLSQAGQFYKQNAYWINPGATALLGML